MDSNCNHRLMRRFLAGWAAFAFLLSTLPSGLAWGSLDSEELRTQGAASAQVRAGLEQRLLDSAQPAAAGMEEGPTVEDLVLAIGDQNRADQWIQEAVGVLPAWSRLDKLGQTPPQNPEEVLSWTVPDRWPTPEQVWDLLSKEPAVVVLGGGHGTRQVLETLAKLGISAISGSNGLDYGGRSDVLYRELENKRNVRPVMMGDDMNLRGEGVIAEILVMQLPDSINPGQPLWPQVAERAVLTTDKGEKITGIRNVLAWWEREPDSQGRSRRFSPEDRAAVVRFLSFAYLVLQVIEQELVRQDGIEIGGQSLQNLLHPGTMVMVGAYPRRGPVDAERYLVGLHLLGEALGGTRWVIPSSFQRPDMVTVHGNLKTGQPHVIVHRGINTTNRALPLAESIKPADRKHLQRYVRDPQGNGVSADEAYRLMREMLDDPNKASILVQPEAYRYDQKTYQEATKEDFQVTDVFLNQLRRAKVIVLAPGNFHESVFSVVSVPGVLQELVEARKRGAEVIWIMNPNNLLFTSGYTAADYGRVLEILLREATGNSSAHLGQILSRVLVNEPPKGPGSKLARIMRGESFQALKESSDEKEQAAYPRVAHQHPRGPVEMGEGFREVFRSVREPEVLRMAKVGVRTVRGVSISQPIYPVEALQAVLGKRLPEELQGGEKAGVEEAAVRSAMQELLGTDLARGQRWPADVPEMLGLTPDDIVDRFIRTWTTRMQNDKVNFLDPDAVRSYLFREAIPWRIILAAGRGTRVSPASLIRKPVTRPDGFSTTVQQAREPIRWAQTLEPPMEDVVVVDAAIAYQLLRERVEVPQADRNAMADRLSALLQAISQDFNQLVAKKGQGWKDEQKAEYRSAATQILNLRQPVANLVRHGWRWSADSRQQGDVAQMLRQLERMLYRTLTGEPSKWVNYVWDTLADEALRYLVEDQRGQDGQSRFLDPGRVADVLGGQAIVIVGAPGGLGASLELAIQRLRELKVKGKERLQEHAYIMPVYSDYATASLPGIPNPYLVGLLAGLSNPEDPAKLPKVITGAKSPLKSLPYAKGNVVFTNPADPAAGAKAIREWRDMKLKEQMDALAGFGKSLRQRGVKRGDIEKLENWDKLGEAMQGKIYEGYDTHTPAPGAQLFYHALNAGIFIFETKLVEDLVKGGIWTPYGPYDYLDPDKAKMHEFWYTTVVEVAAAQGEQVRVVSLGPDSPEGLKDIGRIVKYGAQRQRMVAGRLKEMGVKLSKGAVVTVESGTSSFDPERDLPNMFPRPKGVELKGRVHLASTVKVGEPAGAVRRRAVLDGTDRPVVLLGQTVVPRGVTVTGLQRTDYTFTVSEGQPVAWQVAEEVPTGAVELTPEEMRFLRVEIGVAVTEGARIYLLPQPGWDFTQPGEARRALAQIFEASPDQVWLEGEVALEPSVRIQSGTWVNGWHRPVILRGRTLIGQGRSVEASELTDTVLAPLPALDAFNYRPPHLAREADVFNAVLEGQRVEADVQVRNEKRPPAQPGAGLEEWYEESRRQVVETLRWRVEPSARVLLSPVWDEPTFSGWLGTDLQVRGRIEVMIESDRLLVWKLEGEGLAAQRVGSPVALFQAEPGRAVVVPPGTVIDEQVYKQALRRELAEKIAKSPFDSSSVEEILADLFHQQSEVGALVEPEPGLSEPKTFPGTPYQLTLRPGRAKSIAGPLTPAERPCPLCSAQWEENERAYRRGAYIYKSNKYPNFEGDTVWLALRHQPQNLLAGMLTDMVVRAGGAYNDPVVPEAEWLIEQLLERKEQDDPNIRGINVVVAGPGLYRTFYNDFDHRTSTSHGASIWEHAHYQGTPNPQPIERAELDPIGSVGQARFHWVRDWGAPVFAVRSPQVTVYVYPKLRLDPTPPVPPDRQAYLRMDRAEQDQSPWVLISPAALDMSGNFITSDESTFERTTVEHLRQLLSGAASPKEALKPIEEAIRDRAQRHAAPQAGMEEVKAELHRLKGERWLATWMDAFKQFETMAEKQPELFDTLGILLDQTAEGLGQRRIDVVVPKRDGLSPEEETLVLRYLVAVVNNAAWFLLKQPVDTKASDTRIQLAGPWAQAVKDWIDDPEKTKLIPALSERMLYGRVSLEVNNRVFSTQTMPGGRVSHAQPVRPTFDPTADIPVLGMDVGGTNLKFVVLRGGGVIHHAVIPGWLKGENESAIASMGVAAFLAGQIQQQVSDSGLGTAVPQAIGISWPGPVRTPHILGSVTVEQFLEGSKDREGLIQKVRQGRLPGNPSVLQQELDALRDGRFMDLLKAELASRLGKGIVILPYRDAFAEAFGVAVATYHPAFTGGGTITRGGGTATFTVGTGVGGYFMEKDGRVPIPREPMLYEFGRIVVDMDPTKTVPNRSTRIPGTVRQLFARHLLERLTPQDTEEVGEALAATALVMRDALGVDRATLGGGNARPEIVQAAQTAIQKLVPTGEPGVEVVMSPVLDVMKSSEPIYTPSIGAAWAALADSAAGLEETVGDASRAAKPVSRELPAQWDVRWDFRSAKSGEPLEVPSDYMLKIQSILQDPSIRSELFAQLLTDPTQVQEVRIVHHEKAYSDEGFWYIWEVTFVRRDGLELPLAFKILAPDVKGRDKEQVLEDNRLAYQRFNSLRVPTVPHLFASGEKEGLTFQVVEFAPADYDAADGTLLAEEAIRLWLASAEEPKERFIPRNLDPGGVHFFRDAGGAVQLRFLDFDWLLRGPTEAELFQRLMGSSVVAKQEQVVVEGVIRALGEEAGRAFLQNAQGNPSAEGRLRVEGTGLEESPFAQDIRVVLAALAEQKHGQSSIGRGSPQRRRGLEEAQGRLKDALMQLKAQGQPAEGISAEERERREELLGRAHADMRQARDLLLPLGELSSEEMQRRSERVAEALDDSDRLGEVIHRGWVSLQDVAGFPEGTYLIRTSAGRTPPLNRLVVQTGLTLPRDLPEDVQVIRADAKEAGEMGRFLRRLELQRGDGILFNLGVFSPTQILASLPVELLDSDRRPGIAGLYPHETDPLQPGKAGPLKGAALAFLLQISRQHDRLYVYSVTPVRVRGQTYLLIQA